MLYINIALCNFRCTIQTWDKANAKIALNALQAWQYHAVENPVGFWRCVISLAASQIKGFLMWGFVVGINLALLYIKKYLKWKVLMGSILNWYKV